MTVGGQSMLQIGPINLWGKAFSTIRRPGVDDPMILDIGNQEEPFDLETLASATDAAAARSLLATYDNMRGTRISIVRNGSNYDSLGVKFIVLHVREVEIKSFIGVGQGGTYGATLRAKWTLQPVSGS